MSAFTDGCVFFRLQSGALPTELSEAKCATDLGHLTLTTSRADFGAPSGGREIHSRNPGERLILITGKNGHRYRGYGMGPSAHDSTTTTSDDAEGISSTQFDDLVKDLKRDVEIGQTNTALLDEQLGDFGVPEPRILIIGCGGSGNNIINIFYVPY